MIRSKEYILKIVRRRFVDWDDNTKRRLRHATLPGGYLRKYMCAFPQSPTLVVFARKQIMGWAFVLSQTHNKTVSVNLFVNERYRGQGLATLLIEEALKSFKIISLAKWDHTTQRLFERLQRKHPGRIIIFDWWKNINKYEKIVQVALLSL